VWFSDIFTLPPFRLLSCFWDPLAEMISMGLLDKSPRKTSVQALRSGFLFLSVPHDPPHRCLLPLLSPSFAPFLRDLSPRGGCLSGCHLHLFPNPTTVVSRFLRAMAALVGFTLVILLSRRRTLQFMPVVFPAADLERLNSPSFPPHQFFVLGSALKSVLFPVWTDYHSRSQLDPFSLS